MTLSRIEEVSILEKIDNLELKAERLQYNCSTTSTKGEQHYPYLKGEIIHMIHELRKLIKSPRK